MHLDTQRRLKKLRICGWLALLTSIVLVAAVLTHCFGALSSFVSGHDQSALIRGVVIHLIRAITAALGASGAWHAWQSLAATEAEAEELRERLVKLATVAPTPELLLDEAHHRDRDLVLQAMQWGTRAALLLGLLGTVWGLSLAVAPIAQAVAETSTGVGQVAAAAAAPGAAAPTGSGTVLELVLARTGEAVGSLQTAFSTTLWGVVSAFSLLLLATVCGAARELRVAIVAEAAMDQGRVLQLAKAAREGPYAQAGRDFVSAATTIEKAVKRFETAAESIAKHQELYEQAIKKLQELLEGIAGQIRQALADGAGQLKAAATDVKGAATQLRSASTHSNQQLAAAANKLDKSAHTLEAASATVIATQAESLKAYREELEQATQRLEAQLKAIEEQVEKLPQAIADGARPALDAWSAKQLAELHELVTSLKQSQDALQTFLYWADQSTARREERHEERHSREIEALGVVARMSRAGQEGVAGTHARLDRILQSSEQLRKLIGALGRGEAGRTTTGRQGIFSRWSRGADDGQQDGAAPAAPRPATTPDLDDTNPGGPERS